MGRGGLKEDDAGGSGIRIEENRKGGLSCVPFCSHFEWSV